jgi:TonB family protein
MTTRGRVGRCVARSAALTLALARAASAQSASSPPEPEPSEPSRESPDAGAAASPDVVPPQLLSSPVAAWPPGAASDRDRTVTLIVTIDAAGAVEDARVRDSAGETLDAAALEAARAFHFVPARDAHGPRRARILSQVRFVASSAAAPSALPASSALPAPSAAAPSAADSAIAPAPAVSLAASPSSAASGAAAPDASVAHVRVFGAASPRSASETRIGRRTLQAAPHRNASEMLLTVPGVFVSQHSGEGKAHQIFYRGFDAVHGQDMAVWAAGAPVNEVSNVHGQGYADLHFLIPELVQEIESQPGVYDPRQGDFAVAGSLRFTVGQAEPGVIARAGFGSFGRRRAFLSYRPADAPPETFAAFELESSDGFGPARAARHGSAMAQVEHDLGPLSARLFASTYAGRFDSAGVLRLADIESGRVDRFATYDDRQGGDSSRTQLVLTLTDERPAEPSTLEQPPERWGLSPYLVLRRLRLRSNFTGYLSSPEGDSTQQINETLTLGARAWYRRALPLFSARDGLEAGVMLRSDSIRQSQHRLSLVDDRVTDDEASPGIDAHVRATNATGYVDLALYPLPRLSLRGGLRADTLAFSTEEAGGSARAALGAQLSKRGTAELVLAPGLHAVASYGEGFRSPQARSLADGETTPFTRVVSAETGLRYRLDERLSASLAGFYTHLSDDLLFDPATLGSEVVPATERLGATLSVESAPIADLSASGSVTLARATFAASSDRYAEGSRVPYAPQLTARADAAFTPVLGRLGALGALRSHLGAGVTYIEGRPLPYGETGHDALLFDARASLRLGPLETGLDIYNLFDAAWYDGEFVYASSFGGAASLVPERHVTVGAPRTFMWMLTLSV